MTWQQTLHEDSFTAKDFLFADGRQMDLRLTYPTLGKLASDKGNAVLLLHGTVGSGQQILHSLSISTPRQLGRIDGSAIAFTGDHEIRPENATITQTRS
jgi:homoserine acetyltransferase